LTLMKGGELATQVECARGAQVLLHYSFSITLATSPPHRVHTPVSTSIPDSTFPLTLPIAVISPHCVHQTLFNNLSRMLPGIDSQIFLAGGVSEGFIRWSFLRWVHIIYTD